MNNSLLYMVDQLIFQLITQFGQMLSTVFEIFDCQLSCHAQPNDHHDIFGSGAKASFVIGPVLLLDQLDTALDYCNRVLAKNDRHWRAYNNRALIYIKQKRYREAEQDILKVQELNPNARTLKRVRAMLLDETDPVSPNIEIDDRRHPPRNDEEQ